MEQRKFFIVVLMACITLLSLDTVSSRSHGLKYHHRNSHLHNSNHNHNHHTHQSENNISQNQNKSHPKHVKPSPSSWRLSDEDYDDEEDDGRHAYLMTTANKKTSSEKVTEDQTLTQAFEKHMQPGAANAHDVYAYQLPSDLWFVVRYSKNSDGQTEKYMNVVDSFSNYLEKLDKDVKTVSVNTKGGVETVFRLTPKRKPDN